MWNKLYTKVLWIWHPLLGALSATLIFYGLPIQGVLLFYGFIRYESSEYHEFKDKTGKGDTIAIDVRDFLIGFGITSFIHLLIVLKRTYLPQINTTTF